MSPRHFFHELRRVARESYAVALVPTAVVVFCVGVWHFLWIAREADPAQATALTPSHEQILAFFDDWWPYLGWVFPYLIVKRLDTEDPAGMQRTLPLTRRELLGAKLAFTFLATVALPTAAFAAYQEAIHPENWLVQAGTVAATQWLLACVGAGAALIAQGIRSLAWMVGAYVIFQYVSGATQGGLIVISGRVGAPVFEGTPGAFAADVCAVGLKYAPLLLAPLAVACLAAGFRRLRPASWLMLAVPLGIISPLAQRAAEAPRFAKAEAPEQTPLIPLTPQEARAVAKEPWFNNFKESLLTSGSVSVAKASVTLNAPGLVPGTNRFGWWDWYSVETLSGFARSGDRFEATKVAARIATQVDTESFCPRESWPQTGALAITDHHDRIARLIATGAFPRDVLFWRLGATPKDNRWQTVTPSPHEVRLDLTLAAPAARGATDSQALKSVTVEVPFTRYAAPEILLRAPAEERTILRERNLVATIPKIFNTHDDSPEKEGELRTDIGFVRRAGPFLPLGTKPWEQGETFVQYFFVVFNPVKKQAVILRAHCLSYAGNLWAASVNSVVNDESPQVEKAWLKESELVVVRLRALETVKRLVEIRAAATTPAEHL